jgi:hypothetical protein
MIEFSLKEKIQTNNMVDIYAIMQSCQYQSTLEGS